MNHCQTLSPPNRSDLKFRLKSSHLPPPPACPQIFPLPPRSATRHESDSVFPSSSPSTASCFNTSPLKSFQVFSRPALPRLLLTPASRSAAGRSRETESQFCQQMGQFHGGRRSGARQKIKTWQVLDSIASFFSFCFFCMLRTRNTGGEILNFANGICFPLLIGQRGSLIGFCWD